MRKQFTYVKEKKKNYFQLSTALPSFFMKVIICPFSLTLLLILCHLYGIKYAPVPGAIIVESSGWIKLSFKLMKSFLFCKIFFILILTIQTKMNGYDESLLFVVTTENPPCLILKAYLLQ